jgi:Polyphosphate kinase 2 (PPK2)
MLKLERIYRVERRRGIIALEGWDAAGKGSAIQRLNERLDPRWGPGLVDRQPQQRYHSITLGPPALDPDAVRAAAEILGRALSLPLPERGRNEAGIS